MHESFLFPTGGFFVGVFSLVGDGEKSLGARVSLSWMASHSSWVVLTLLEGGLRSLELLESVSVEMDSDSAHENLA